MGKNRPPKPTTSQLCVHYLVIIIADPGYTTCCPCTPLELELAETPLAFRSLACLRMWSKPEPQKTFSSLDFQAAANQEWVQLMHRWAPYGAGSSERDCVLLTTPLLNITHRKPSLFHQMGPNDATLLYRATRRIASVSRGLHPYNHRSCMTISPHSVM